MNILGKIIVPYQGMRLNAFLLTFLCILSIFFESNFRILFCVLTLLLGIDYYMLSRGSKNIMCAYFEDMNRIVSMSVILRGLKVPLTQDIAEKIIVMVAKNLYSSGGEVGDLLGLIDSLEKLVGFKFQKPKNEFDIQSYF